MFRFFTTFSALALLLLIGTSVHAVEGDAETYAKTVNQAVDFLKSSQAEDGSFSANTGPSITSLVIASVLKHGRSPDEPWIKKSLNYMESYAQKDGGIYRPESTHKNYETSISLMAFIEANKDGRYDKTIEGATKFLKGLQWDEGEDKEKTDTFYGGAGYGGHKRPDLSNTTFLVDALKSAGTAEDDPAMQRALIFISRCQNLETEHNTTEFAAKNPDGGFYYTPADGGTSQAGKTDTGGLRSYASMTYAGLKSMIYAGVDKDDVRVKAAITWLKDNYDLDSNPGMGQSGLYYYYQTVAKTMDALEVDSFVETDGTKHDWRSELLNELAERQQKNGSWTNENDRWMEGDPNLVTGYALLALSYCKPVK